MVATERIAATKQVDLSYSPGGASVHPDFMHGFFGIRESPTSPNSISKGSAVFSRLTVVTTTHTHGCSYSLMRRVKEWRYFASYFTKLKRKITSAETVENYSRLFGITKLN